MGHVSSHVTCAISRCRLAIVQLVSRQYKIVFGILSGQQVFAWAVWTRTGGDREQWTDSKAAFHRLKFSHSLRLINWKSTSMVAVQGISIPSDAHLITMITSKFNRSQIEEGLCYLPTHQYPKPPISATKSSLTSSTPTPTRLATSARL